MIKLRMVIGGEDETYIRRLADYISLYYSDRIELYFFTKIEVLNDFLRGNRVNGLFVEQGFLPAGERISPNMAFACLLDGREMEQNQEIPVLMKYQNADVLIKEMLSLCSEQVSQLHTGTRPDGDGRVYLFESPAGGVGTTTLACAFAYSLHRQGKRVLYLNLERFGTMHPFFGGEGRMDLGDLLYALRARRGNFLLKLESVVRQDLSGVSYVEPCRHAADTESMQAEDIVLLIRSVMDSGMYDYVIIDRNSGVAEADYELRRCSDQIVLVSDGSPLSNAKLQKLYEALRIYEENETVSLLPKVKILYNRFGSHTGCRLELDQTETLGGFPRYEGMEERAIMEQISEKDVFLNLCQKRAAI